MAKTNKDARDRQILIEDARIVFRNFAGVEGPFNRKGDRNFAVILDDDIAELLSADGWNVKTLAPREEGDTPTPYLPVAVKYEVRPPRIVMISSSGKTQLNVDTVETLDYAEIAKADVLINPYDWEVNGKTGTKAYLKSLYVTVEEDALERKYAALDAPEELLDE